MLRGLLFFIIPVLAYASQVEDVLVPLCDPAKLATLSERGANPRVRKIAYWLELGRQRGEDPAVVMANVMRRIGWNDLRGELTAAAMVRNRLIAERLGCLDPPDMELLRGGRSPKVERGPYAGTLLSTDHIIPRSVCAELDNVLANLELMPMGLNAKKGAAVGQRQVDLAAKLRAAGLLSADGAVSVSKAASIAVGQRANTAER